MLPQPSMGSDKDVGDEPNTPLLWFVRFLKVLAIVCLVANIAAFILIINAGVKSTNNNGLDKAFIVLANVGMMMIVLLLILAEFEPVWFIRHVMVLHYWPGRGFWLLWLGIQTVSGAQRMAHEIGGSSSDALKIVGVVVGWILISVGALYCVLGALCVHRYTMTDRDKQLEASLLAGPSGDTSTDAVLAANLALGLGMTPDQAKKKFKGSSGAKEASAYAKKQQEELAKLKRGLDEAQRKAKDAAAVAAVQSAAAVAATKDAARAGAAAAASAAADRGSRNATPPAAEYAAPAVAPARSAAYGAEDDGADGPRKKKGMTDEDLEAAYYANKKFDH